MRKSKPENVERLNTYDRVLLKSALVVLGLAVVMLLWIPGRSSRKNSGAIGTIETTDKARRLGPKDTAWTEVKNGPTFPGDFVATEDMGSAVVKFKDDTSVTLSPSSIIEIVPLAAEGQYEVVLHQGKVASSPGLNIRQSDRFNIANLPSKSPSLAMPGQVLPLPSAH